MKHGDLVYHIYSREFYKYDEEFCKAYSFCFSNNTYKLKFKLITAYLVKATKAQEYLYA